jgi:hypothetical protein
VRDGLADHGKRRTQGAMLGMGQGRVNDGHAERPQEGQIQRLQAIPSPCQSTVSEGSIRSFILCGLSPPVSPRRGMVSPIPFDQMMEMTQTQKQLFMEPASQERRFPLIPRHATARERRRKQVRSTPKLQPVGYSSV